MSKKAYWKCDECGVEKEMPANPPMLMLSCGTDNYDFPCGDFCSIECILVYLNHWKICNELAEERKQAFLEKG